MSAPLSIQTTPLGGAPGRGFDAIRCKAGDRLVARIITVRASGHTWLQLAGVKGVAPQLPGGRVGDVLLLEVAPRGSQTGALQGAGGESARGLSSASGRLFEIAVRQNGRLIRLPVFLKSGAPQSASAESGSSAHRSGGLNQTSALPPTMVSTVQTALAAIPGARVFAAWLEGLRKAAPRPSQRGGDRAIARRQGRTKAGRLFQRLGEARPRPAFEPGDPQPETNLGTGWAGFQLDDLPLRFRFRRRAADPHRGSTEVAIDAGFLVVLEGLGAVRTDLHMGAERLSVIFFVEHADSRKWLETALPDLETALRPLARRCCCRVALAPSKIEAFWAAEGGRHPEAAPLDVRI